MVKITKRDLQIVDLFVLSTFHNVDTIHDSSAIMNIYEQHFQGMFIPPRTTAVTWIHIAEDCCCNMTNRLGDHYE